MGFNFKEPRANFQGVVLQLWTNCCTLYRYKTCFRLNKTSTIRFVDAILEPDIREQFVLVHMPSEHQMLNYIRKVWAKYKLNGVIAAIYGCHLSFREMPGWLVIMINYCMPGPVKSYQVLLSFMKTVIFLQQLMQLTFVWNNMFFYNLR